MRLRFAIIGGKIEVMCDYQPSEIEAKWSKIWEEKGLNCVADKVAGEPNYYCLVMFPYPSGDLHIGHWYNFAAADVFVRFQRMNGKNVLHPMGFDAFGLPAEGAAIKRKVQPSEWTRKNIDRMIQQLKTMGTIYDWSRMVNTSQPEYYRWTQWLFLQMFKHGLAYKKKAMANWCPKCQSILANEQAEGGKCWRCETEVEQREIEQWFFKITKYADELLADLKKLDWPKKTKIMQENWIGRSEGILIKFQIPKFQIPNKIQIPNSKFEIQDQIEVFTTRPDTIFGATFLVVAPEHPLVATLLKQDSASCHSESAGRRDEESRGNQGNLSSDGILQPRQARLQDDINFKEIKAYVTKARKKTELQRQAEMREKTGVFSGLYAINPLTKKEIPIYIADFVLSSYGTGAIMAVPGHDHRDWEFAKKFNLPIVEVIEGGEVEKEAYVGEGKMVNSGQFDGLNSKKAMVKITEYILKNQLGKKEIQYHLRDWLVSRQRYWGAPIPMVYCEACAKKGISYLDKFQITKSKFQINSKLQNPNKKLENCNLFGASNFEFGASRKMAGWFPVPEDELPALLPMISDYTPKEGESPLARAVDWIKMRCPQCGGEARRDTDTMDTFVCSSWYYLAFAFWHKHKDSKYQVQSLEMENIFTKYKDLLKAWLPVKMYIGGAEHTVLHLLYSRFFTKALRDMGYLNFDEPFLALRHQGIILGEDGFKMSKSRGNVVNPDELVKKYGVDAVRLYLCFMGPYDQGGPWNSKGIAGVDRFLRRVWRMVEENSKLQMSNFKQIPNYKIQITDKKEIDILLNKTIKKVTEDIGSFNFNTAIAALMELVNSLKLKAESQKLQTKEIETLILLLAPFAPHMCEEMWEKLKNLRTEERKNEKSSLVHGFIGSSVHQQPWPKYDPKLIVEEKVTIVIQVNGKLRDKMEVDVKIKQKEIEKMALTLEKIKPYLQGKKILKTIFVPGRLVNLVVGCE